MNTNGMRSAVIFIFVVVLGIFTAMALFFFQTFYNSENFLPGVKIADVSVQGQSIKTASQVVEEWLDEVYDTKVVFSKDEYKYETSIRDLCEPINTQQLVEDLWQAEKERNLRDKIINLDGTRSIIYPIELRYSETVLKDLESIFSKELSQPYQNARLEFNRQNGITITSSSPGTKVNFEATFKTLPAHVRKFENKQIFIPIHMEITNPEITESDFEDVSEISTYTTWFNIKEVDRSHNLMTAANAINGSIVIPGQVFSFNETVGQRTLESGYRSALVIINGRFEPGVGGGICQVSSTLYNTSLLAGLEIIERHNHALAIAYVPLGRDASVAYGVQDFKIRNNLNSPIYIRTLSDNGKLTISVYGNNTDKKVVAIENIVDATIPYKTITAIDYNLAPGTKNIEQNGSTGYVVRSFRIIYDKNGNVAKREQLAKDIYKTADQIVHIGPEPKPELDVKPEPEPKPDPEPQLPNDTIKEPTQNNGNEVTS